MASERFVDCPQCGHERWLHDEDTTHRLFPCTYLRG
jgi:hypothetical protein